jgi:hypothetical protein
MATMHLYRLGEYIPTDTIPTLPIVSFEQSIELKNVPTFPMDELERIWKEKKQIVFMLHYLDGMDVYYFLLPTDYPDTTEYWHHESNDQHRKWDHCDFYASRILERFLERFQRRLNTRTLLSEIHQQIQHELNITDETEPHFQEALYETLCTIHLDDYHDRHLIQSVRDEVREKVETERRYRPDGDGYHEAKQDFEQSVDHHRF